ncbi:MAG: hypothetical protein ACKVX7_07810, partial [Planctomycetota bacterium]
KSWPHSGFRVHAERIIPPGDQRGLESILEYFERPPVSLKSLTSSCPKTRLRRKAFYGRNLSGASPGPT